MLRADAEDNRGRVLEAARTLFADRGLQVTMREVARTAGVGPATLYRRFPTRQDLIEAAFDDELRACRSIVEEGAADPDAWRGLCSIVTRISELNARNHGFVDAFLVAHPARGDFRAHRASLLRTFAALAERARASGRLRADVEMEDIVVLLLAGRGLATGPLETRLARARRYAALQIAALRAPEAR
jgi:AcrR family transcriptional regulator